MGNKDSNNKKKSDILLSIGVITYNNPVELRRFLLGVLPQMRPGVEIVINDNSENLEIASMVKNEFNSPYVRYFKNETNVEFDGNIILATERSLGKYVWWCGNDEICEGVIQHVLNVLRKEPDVSFVFVNFYIADQGSGNPAIKIDKDKFFKDNNQVLEEIANILGFMSSIIIKKEKFANIDKDKMNSFIGSGFINFFIVMHVLAQNGKAYFVAYPYVRCYPTLPEMSHYDGFPIFGVSFFRVAKNFEKYFSKKSLKKMLAKNFGHVWRGLLVENVKGRSIAPIRRLKILFKYYWNFPEFWIALPFFLMPRFVNVFFYKSYKKLTGKNEYLKRKFSKVPWF